VNQETWDAACARIAELEAENAELRRLHDMHIKDRKDWQATIERLNGMLAIAATDICELYRGGTSTMTEEQVLDDITGRLTERGGA